MGIASWINEHILKHTPFYQKARVLQLAFRGWRDAESERRAPYGSVDIYLEEIQAGRLEPPFPAGLILVRTLTARSTAPTGAGATRGAVVVPMEVLYNPDYISERTIRSFLDQVGIVVD